MRRTHNEDCFGILEKEALFLVADGMGGHAAGEVASGIAMAEIGSFYQRSYEDPRLPWPYDRLPSLNVTANRLMCGIKVANRRIFEYATGNQARRGMGTTLVGLGFAGNEVSIAHVGDSRAYRISDHTIERLTRDHSLLEQFKEINPGMTREEENNFPHKNVITRALGLNEDVEVEIKSYELKTGDIYLICSDGLCGQLIDEEILEIVNEDKKDLRRACAELVDAANAAGGPDNITLVIVSCG